ncbi:MAG: glycerate kinase [Pseudomonadota bacterium]
MKPPRAFLTDLFDAALKAADPFHSVPQYLPDPPRGRTIVVGAGKASARMAQALESAWAERGDGADLPDGLVIVPYGSRLPTERIEIVEARHPVPDAAGEAAARRILETVSGLTEDDLVLCLISGGGSALLSVPGSGLTLADKQAVNKALLASGAAIGEMNCVRKHLSAIKGGRLAAAAAPAKVVTLTISDVPGDDPALIASGPTVPGTTRPEDAMAILARYQVAVPDAVTAFLETAAAQTPDAAALGISRLTTKVIATPQASLEAAAEIARQQGVTPIILGDTIEGEARDVGTVMAGIARQVRRHGQPMAPPAVLITGGETTVTVRGEAGRGGRNSEFLLAFAVASSDCPDLHAIACDTDGIDGSEDNAGAYWGPDIAARAQAASLSARDYLDRHDAYSFFEAVDSLVVTGPTHTNVNDFRAIYIGAEGA